MDQSKNKAPQKNFITTTDTEYTKTQTYQATACIFCGLSLFASLGFLIAWQTFVIFEIAAFFICVISAMHITNNTHDYKLRFEADILYVTDRTSCETFEVYDISASDFIITQTKKEKKIDYCGMAIKNTVFIFGSVKNCSELKKYIAENYT